MQVDIEVRSPSYNQYGGVDVEINHPVFGWIPFTASPDDVEEHGKAIYQACLDGQFGPIAPYTL